jgi:hypothetical protein
MIKHMQNSRNVLIASDPSTEYGVTAKIADLGLARAMRGNRTHMTTSTVGTCNAVLPCAGAATHCHVSV